MTIEQFTCRICLLLMGGRSDVQKRLQVKTCSLFVLGGYMKKPFRTLEEQIEILKNRGLDIRDENFSKLILHRYSYYDIVNGYKSYFIDKNLEEETFLSGVTLEDLFSLYLFDSNLRDLTLSTIQKIEHVLRSITSYRIAESYGSEEVNYLCRENYNLGHKFDKKYELDKLFYKFEKILQDDIHPYKHYREKYKNCPPWILLKGTSLGNLIVFIRLQKKEIKEKIIADFFLRDINEITEKEKNFFMDLILEFRNRAAHGNRIYNFKPQRRKINFVKYIHERIGINEEMYASGIGSNDWNAIIVFLSFIQDDTLSIFLEKLVHCLNRMDVKSDFSKNVVRHGMGLLDTMIGETETTLERT